VAFVGIAHFVTRLFACRLPFWPALGRSLALALSLFAFVVVSIVALDFAWRGVGGGAAHPDFVLRYLRTDEPIAERLMRAERAVANSFAPAPDDLAELPQRTAVPQEHYGVSRPPVFDAPIYPNFTLEEPGSTRSGGTLGLLALGAIVSGAALMIARGGVARMAAAACLGVLGFNLVLHSVWGDEFVLYSEHWMAAAIVLIGGNLLLRGSQRTWAGIGVAAYTLAISVSNAGLLSSLVATLRGILLFNL
jgi:hypothetical protein